MVLALAGFSAVAQSQRALPRRPNIILIVANGLAAGDLSCYGQTQFQTPNLDKLASEGIRFTHYSAGGITSSRALATLMTGKESGPMDADVTLAPDDRTIAQVLRDSGYFTCLVGQWNLGDQNSPGAPWLKGFIEFGGYLTLADAENAYADFIYRYEPNPMPGQAPTFNGPEMVYANTGNKKVQYIPDWLITLGMNFAKQHQPEPYNRYQPFFLQLNFSVPGNGDRVVPTDAPFSEEPWPQPEKNRAAMIGRLDGYIGQLLEHLDKINQASNTVIFFTSDTVPQKTGGTDPKFFQENTSDDLLVPMIVHWPGKIPAGQVNGLDCSARDFLPTAADIGFVAPPQGIDGTSFAPALFGRAIK
jgi:arylsulfatase A-like enzyme